MSIPGQLAYQLNVNVLGKSALRVQRWQAERKLAKPGAWKHATLNAPIDSSPWLKELIMGHYLTGRFANGARKVAWVTSGAPVEFLKALDYFLIYPENHGAVCGIRRVGEEMCTYAEDFGYSRDLCSYARADIGSVLSGKTPVGKLPKPDLLLCCNNICQTVLYWYQVLAHHFNVPLIVIDTPFLYGEAHEHDLASVKRQIEDAFPVAERVAGKTIEPKHLEDVMLLSRDAVDLWLKVLQTGRNRPSPITAFDEFIHMAPIVEMRGEQMTVDYYRAMLNALEARAKDGVGALKHETKRILWDNLPIWYRIRPLGEKLAEHGVAMVASTYTNAWGELAELINADHPMDSMAKCYLHPILNRGTGHKLATMQKMMTEYAADGVILHSDRSCKPYSIGQIDQRNAVSDGLGKPALLLEADHTDNRAYSVEQADTRISAFLELLGV
jgi:benzoyl-CoA reductase/2-hydroxyglutaryl-CoA dehydratase subunit BcrC/BadD/HgdB